MTKTPSKKKKHPKTVPGTRLVHERGGETLARCTATAAGFKFAGKTYPSISAAGSAAAKALGKHASVNGWVFWAVQK